MYSAALGTVKVAVKDLNPESFDIRKQIEQEIRSLSSINSPYVFNH